MKLETTRFGEIDIDEKERINFPQGLYGFKSEKEFVLLATDETPFFWLQSVANPELAFIVTEPWGFCSNYEFDLKKEVQNELNVTSKDDVMVINMVVIPDDPQEMTMNLKAPVIINRKERLGKQIILDDERYAVKYKLLQEERSVS